MLPTRLAMVSTRLLFQKMVLPSRAHHHHPYSNLNQTQSPLKKKRAQRMAKGRQRYVSTCIVVKIIIEVINNFNNYNSGESFHQLRVLLTVCRYILYCIFYYFQGAGKERKRKVSEPGELSIQYMSAPVLKCGCLVFSQRMV